jgi:hypothetical protein
LPELDGQYDAVFLRISAFGKLAEPAKTFSIGDPTKSGDDTGDWALSGTPTSNGLLVVGTSGFSASEPYDPFVLKLDKTGSLEEWETCPSVRKNLTALPDSNLTEIRLLRTVTTEALPEVSQVPFSQRRPALYLTDLCVDP